MKEDIKILEDYAYAICTISSTTEQDQRIAQAIKSLISRNKELEEKNKKLEEKNKKLENHCKRIEKENWEYITGTNETKYYSVSIAKNNFIPKSKVREKIEELEKEINPSFTSIKTLKRIFAKDILQELLQEE